MAAGLLVGTVVDPDDDAVVLGPDLERTGTQPPRGAHPGGADLMQTGDREGAVGSDKPLLGHGGARRAVVRAVGGVPGRWNPVSCARRVHGKLLSAQCGGLVWSRHGTRWPPGAVRCVTPVPLSPSRIRIVRTETWSSEEWQIAIWRIDRSQRRS